MARVGLKRIRKSLNHIKTKGYIRLITVFVLAGIFIAESAENSASYTKGAKMKSSKVSKLVDVKQVSSEGKSENITEIRNVTDSTMSSERIARTLNELLQEAIPEQIFGFSNKDRGIADDGETVDLASPLEKTTIDTVRSDTGRDRDSQLRYLEDNDYSRTALMIKERRQASRNEIETKKTSWRRTTNGPSPFKGVLPTEETQHLFQKDNLTHLSFMLYRIIKTHDIKSVLDVPCKESMLWIRDLLQVLEFEVPKFHYKCLTPDDMNLAEGVMRFQHLSSATVLKDEKPWASRLPYADLALCWYGLGFLPPSQSWGLVKALRTARVKFVLVPNYPNVRRNPGSGSALGRINIRRAPYRFSEPLRVMNNISAQRSSQKQLLFYELEGIRRGFL